MDMGRRLMDRRRVPRGVADRVGSRSGAADPRRLACARCLETEAAIDRAASPPSSSRPPQDELRVIFDDETLADKHVNTTPTTNPDSVWYAWHSKGREELVAPLNADPIWTQCDIQFRMVAFSSCEVPIEAMMPPDDIECGNNPLRAQQGKVIDAVDACTAAMKKPGIRVIVTGQLEGPICPGVAGLTDLGDNVTVVDQDALASAPNAIPHEIGHMLELPDSTIKTPG